MRIPAENHPGKRPEDKTESDSQDKDTRLRFADDTTHDMRVDEVADDCDRQAAEYESGPEAPSERFRESEDGKCAKHHELAMSEVDDLGCLVNEDKAERDQPVGAALRYAGDSQVDDVTQRQHTIPRDR
jgi:hypothetical protein